MALLWRRRHGGNRYEVRTAGRTRRLYTNGICHTDYNPNRPVTRSIWDLLFLPALFRPAGSVRRVLVLGVGGGSVIRLLQHYLQPDRIVGVELSDMHLMIARRFFGLGDANTELHAAEAASWLEAYDGPAFDLIIDDLFLEEGDEALRAVDCDSAWFSLLLRNLTKDGVLTINFPDYAALKDCAWFSRQSIARRLPAGFVFHTPYLDNAVAAFLRFPAETAVLRRHMQAVPALARAAKLRQLRYRIRRLPAAK